MKAGVWFLVCLFVLTHELSGVEAQTGRLSVQAGLGLHRTGLAQVSGGMNLVLGQVAPSPEIPLDLGLSGRVSLATGGLASGVYGTARWGWKALHSGNDVVNRFDLSLGLGLGLVPLVGLDAYGAVGYHLDPRWTFLLEGTPFGVVLGAAYLF